MPFFIWAMASWGEICAIPDLEIPKLKKRNKVKKMKKSRIILVYFKKQEPVVTGSCCSV
jgi:hypothetical protein